MQRKVRIAIGKHGRETVTDARERTVTRRTGTERIRWIECGEGKLQEYTQRIQPELLERIYHLPLSGEFDLNSMIMLRNAQIYRFLFERHTHAIVQQFCAYSSFTSKTSLILLLMRPPTVY